MSVVHVETITMMAKLQDQLNAIINPNWLTAGNDWHRAAWIEAGELADHIGWKWWKKQEPNWPQAKIEVVDIWHFVLSDYLVRHGIQAGVVLTNEINDPEIKVVVYKGGVHRVNDLPLLELVDVFASLAAQGTLNACLFNHLRERVGLNWADVQRMYLAKNALNIFRQRNGYKEGTYVKEWRGTEDNVFLEKVLEANPSIDFATLMDTLQREYLVVLAEKARV